MYEEWGDADRIIKDAMPNIEAGDFSEQEIRKYLVDYLNEP